MSCPENSIVTSVQWPLNPKEKAMSINPDELFKVLSGDAGVVKCPFCHTDNRVPDVQTPMGLRALRRYVWLYSR